MIKSKIKFESHVNSSFFKEVKERVDEYFKRTGYTRKANKAMIIKIVIIGILFFGSYGAIVSGKFSEKSMLLLAILFGFSNALIAFNISHDAAHGALFVNQKLNLIFSYTFNLIGVNRYIWNIKHNVSHHAYTNVPGYDLDIDQSKVARLVNSCELKWFHKYQYIYVPLLFPFASLYLVFIKDFQMFSLKKIGTKFIFNHPKKEYFILFFSKIIYFTYVLAIPIIVLNVYWWKVLFGFLIMHLILGVFLAIILFPAHIADDSPFPEPDENGIIHNSWAVHQVETTTNYGPNNKILCWISGGLNTHIAHHLFPGICHIHYFKITNIIRTIAQKHRINYRDNTIYGAVRSHINFLKIMGVGDYVHVQPAVI